TCPLSHLRCVYTSRCPCSPSFKHTATPVTCPLSLHDALPISGSGPRRPPTRAAPHRRRGRPHRRLAARGSGFGDRVQARAERRRSEEHTSELQSRENLVCRLLLEKKKRTRS